MNSNSLPISRLINVQLNRSQLAAQAQNTNDVLVLGSSPVIDTTQRIRSYNSLPAVAGDFGTTAPEYLAAAAWFGQSPQPTSIYIGRWVKSNSAAQLIGASLSTAQQLLANFIVITSGGFSIDVDGTEQQLSGINLSTATNLNGVASLINETLTGATIEWNAGYEQFVVTTTATGASATLGFATAPSAGTDISSLLGLTVANSGSYVAQGAAAETALAAVSLFDINFGQQWYGLFVCGAADADHLAIAPYIEASTNLHVYGVNTQEAGALVSSYTTDIAYLLSQGGYDKTMVQYSSNSAYAVMSLLGRQLTVDYTGNNTVITLEYKQEPGVAPENLNATQIAALEGKKCNVFTQYNNNTAIIEPAVCSSGEYIDFIIGSDVFGITLQNAIWNVNYQSTTKIPQTDAGIHLYVVTAESILAQFVNNGFLAPGIWQSAGFGTLKAGDFVPKGFYVYANPVASQTQAARASRVTPPIQIAALCAGAVHKVNLIVNFQQ